MLKEKNDIKYGFMFYKNSFITISHWDIGSKVGGNSVFCGEVSARKGS